jgi:hypothetical protein
MGSGLCVKAECDPACGDGEMCRLLPGGASCVAAPVTATQMTALRPISPGAAPAQSLGLPRAPGAGVAPYYLSPTYLLVPPPVLAPPPGAL